MTTPPHNNDAERAILGAALQSPHLIDDLANLIDPGDLYQPNHEQIWTAIAAIHGRGGRPDPITVARELGAEANRIGGLPYLHELTTVEVCPVPAQAPTYAREVRDHAIARRLIEASIKIRQIAEQATDVRAAAEDCRQAIDAATSEASRVDTGIGAADLVSRTLDAMEAEQDAGIRTGWADLDATVNGLRPGQLVIVGARPSVGKSIIAANLTAAACKAGVGVHFASLEMSREEVMQRLLAAHATVNLARLVESSQMTEGDWERIAAKSSDVMGWPLWVDDQGAQSLLQLRARARSTARRLPLGLIVVDYLQLMAPRTRAVAREQQVGELSEGLKALAKELRVPIVALAQVNRGSAERQDKRPLMSDLRESGRIEADADHVWLLHREDMVNPQSTSGELEVIVAKNRNGASGATVRLAFQGHYARATALAWRPTGAIA